MRYPIVVHKDEDSSYGVTVPDIPGCFSGGESLEEVFENAVEAIAGHVETLLMDDQPVPTILPLDTHLENEDYRDSLCWAFVDVQHENMPDRAVRVNITMPSRILAAVDGAAARSSETRSGFLVRLAVDYMNREAAR